MEEMGHDPFSEDGDAAPVDLTSLMPAMDALLTVESLLGGAAQAKREIADRMRDGRLDAYAARAWDSTKIDITKAWDEEPDPSKPAYAYLERFAISLRSWRRSKQWSVDQDYWRWPSGRFSTVQSRNPTLRFMFEGVHFDPKQINSLVKGLSSRLSSSKSLEQIDLDQSNIVYDDVADERDPKRAVRRPRGAPVRNAAWAKAALEVIRLRDEGILFRPPLQNKAALTRHLSAFLGKEEPLSESSLRYFCQAIWERLKPGP